MAEASSTTTASDGPGEEAVLDRMLTRLALTQDTQLEKVLSKLLPLAISRLGSSHHPTRLKVMEILTHINKRVKDQVSIKLPLIDLLKLYQSPDAVPMVRNFAIVYIEMAFERSTVEEKSELVPSLMLGISTLPAQHQDMVLRMAVKGMEKFATSHHANFPASSYSFVHSPSDCALFVEFCLQTLLYQTPMTTPSQGAMAPPAGLSLEQVTRVTGKKALKGDALATCKLGILNVLAELDLAADLVYPLFLVSSADNNERVSKRGDELLKRKANGANLEDMMLIKRLFAIYQGTTSPGGTAQGRVAPAGPTLKTRLMAVFLHSVAAANAFPSTLQCVFDCIYGAGTTVRLKQAGMEFAVWIFKHASDEQLKPMAPIILASLIKLLDGSDINDPDASSRQVRAFTYQAIGQLAQRAPHLFSGSTDMAVRMFGAIRTESDSVKPTVQEALSSLAAAYKGCSAAVAKEVEALLLENAAAVAAESRFCSILWATHLYPSSHAPSRYLCMLGAADSKLDIREMAQQGLTVSTNENQVSDPKQAYPSLESMMGYICERQPGVLAPALLGERVMLFPPKAYMAMIKFLQECYKSEQNTATVRDNDTLSTSEEIKEFEPSLRGVAPIDAFQSLLEHAMAFDGSSELQALASTGLLVLAAANPEKFSRAYCNRLPWLKQFIGHIDATTREAMARLLGIVTAALSPLQAATLLEELLSTFSGSQKGRFEDLHGAVCASGYVLAECMTSESRVPEHLLLTAIAALFEEMNSANTTLAGSAAEAIGHAGLRVPLPLPAGDLTSGEGLSMALVVKRLASLLASKEVKLVQKAVLAFGHLCFGNRNTELSETALTALFTLSRSKAEDVLFSIGEALAFIWGGVSITADKILKSAYVSLSASSNFLTGDAPASGGDVEMSDAGNSSDDSQCDLAREKIIRKLFDELLFSSRKEERCAGSVWLLSIVSYCGRQTRVQQMLPQIQEAFSHLLGEQNELTQEMASRGMSIVYELGDAATKDELVMALVGNLTGTAKKKRAVKLTEDSEVFEDGAIGETPGGGSIGTYKELCNIANEMGQPDLIYKFMDLANYQTSLNSRRGAAFGFSRIAKQAGDALKPHLRTLFPKLFRYQYDPNKRIQDAMGHIWKSLVAEPKKTVDEYFDDIMDDLLVQAGSRLWRSRESACLALADLLQGRRFSEVGKYLERLWIMAFRAIDDIKETVRLAGDSLSKSVSSVSLRLSDTTLTPEADARATLAIVLPFLLTNGILSTVADVRRLSINTIMKLVKGAGNAVRPQMPDLVGCMLESLSSLEDQRLNYAELHAERVGISTEKLENIRIAVAKDSPMWDTLDLCIRHVDVPTLEILIPRLVQLIRSGIGLNTRVGVAKFISMLAQHVGVEMRPHSATLLKVLFLAVQTEHSAAARRAFAAACGTVAKYSGENQVRKLILDSISLYDSSGNQDLHLASALVLKELSRHANELFKGNLTVVLPLAFVAKFDEEKDISSIFEEIWEDNISSTSVALGLYMPEIVARLKEGIGSSSWPQKKKCAQAVSEVAKVAGDSTAPYVQDLLAGLLAELPGRLWEGKEAVLEAIGNLCEGCSKAISPHANKSSTAGLGPDSVIAAISAASSRKKSSFRNAAFACLEQVLKAFKDQDVYEQVGSLIVDACMQPPVRKQAIPADEGTSDKAIETKETSAVPYEKALACLAASISAASPSTISMHGESITSALVATLSAGHTWQVKQSALSAVDVLLKKLREDGPSGVSNPSTESITVWPSIPIDVVCLVLAQVLVGLTQVHVAALEQLEQLVETANLGQGLTKTLGQTVESRLLELQHAEKNAAAKPLISHILNMLRDHSISQMQE
ncbi:unnamed protein product [Sphagnum balticum]